MNKNTILRTNTALPDFLNILHNLNLDILINGNFDLDSDTNRIKEAVLKYIKKSID